MILVAIILLSANASNGATVGFRARQSETEVPLMREEITKEYARLEKSFKERATFPQNCGLCDSGNCCNLDVGMDFFFDFMCIVAKLKVHFVSTRRKAKEFREHLLQVDLFNNHDSELKAELAMVMKQTLEEEWGEYDSQPFSKFNHQLHLQNLYKTADKFFRQWSESYTEYREKGKYSDYCGNIGKTKEDKQTYRIIAEMFQYCLEHVGIKDNPEENLYALSLLIARIPQFYSLRSRKSYGESAKLALAKLGVFYYTACGDIGGPYRQVNKGLREGTPENLIGHTGYIMKGFEYVRKNCKQFIARPGIYWRGMTGVTKKQFQKFRIGEEALWPGFFSCSRNRAKAEEFLQPEKGRKTDSVLFEVVIPENSRALYVAKMSEYPEEKEVVIYPYQRFRITCLKKGPDFRGIIQMELIENSNGPEINEEPPTKKPKH